MSRRRLLGSALTDQMLEQEQARMRVLSKGDQGAPGATGPAGATGAQGAAGAAGATGAAGAQGATGVAGPAGATGATGAPGAAGAGGAAGPQGPAGVNAFGAPVARTVALGTAYAASTTAKPAMVTLNLTSTSSLSLAGGVTASADIVVASTAAAAAAGTGTVVGKYSNGLTGALVVGLAVNAVQTTPFTFALPAGWFFAVRQTAGTVTVVSAFDQTVG